MNQLNTYLNSEARNRLIIHFEQLPELHYLDIGLELAELLHSTKDLGKLSLKFPSLLQKALSQGTKNHPTWGSYLAVNNIGLLFEEDLKLDFARFLFSYSQNIPLFLLWDGEFDSHTLYFLSKENGIPINLHDLSYIVL